MWKVPSVSNEWFCIDFAQLSSVVDNILSHSNCNVCVWQHTINLHRKSHSQPLYLPQSIGLSSTLWRVKHVDHTKTWSFELVLWALWSVLMWQVLKLVKSLLYLQSLHWHACILCCPCLILLLHCTHPLTTTPQHHHSYEDSFRCLLG